MRCRSPKEVTLRSVETSNDTRGPLDLQNRNTIDSSRKLFGGTTADRRRSSQEIDTDDDSLKVLRDHHEGRWIDDSEQDIWFPAGAQFDDSGKAEDDDIRASTNTSNFKPSSKDVRELFPRGSSLSPTKRKRASRRRRHSAAGEQTWQEISQNTVHARQPRDPWARARESKVEHIQKAPQAAASARASVPADYCAHFERGELRSRVCGLEYEVARLNSEVSTLKAVLHRYGVPIPKGK